MKPVINNYFCYFIRSNNLTYAGYTVDLKRRLRQHNGELVGGARSTANKGPWSYFAVLHSKAWINVSRAMQVEFLCKYPTRKKPRPKKFSRPIGRILSIPDIVERLNNDFVTLFVDESFYSTVSLMNLPASVTLCNRLDEISKQYDIDVYKSETKT
jgi:predicted GIY-YIG superfamily endonuclease